MVMGVYDHFLRLYGTYKCSALALFWPRTVVLQMANNVHAYALVSLDEAMTCPISHPTLCVYM